MSLCDKMLWEFKRKGYATYTGTFGKSDCYYIVNRFNHKKVKFDFVDIIHYGYDNLKEILLNELS